MTVELVHNTLRVVGGWVDEDHVDRLVADGVDPTAARVIAVGAARARADAAMVSEVMTTALSIGQHLLEEKGYSSVEELRVTARKALVAETRRLTVAEVQAAVGLGAGEASELVGLATAPPTITAPVLASMSVAEAGWALARRLWQEVRLLPVEQAALVAEVLHGSDVALAASERLTPDGKALHGRAWSRKEYESALAREVTRARAEDTEGERRRRVSVHRRRDAWITTNPDGEATLSLRGSLTTMVGIHARIERAARLLRKRGDERTLPQLRHDICAALLAHGVLPLPEKERAEDLTTEDIEAIAAVLNAMAPVSLEVHVPLTALTDHDLVPRGEHETGRQREAREVAEIIGQHPAFVSPDLVRQLCLQPGTVLHRILYDPATGRCVDRSSTGYRPDAQLRRFLAACDVYSRRPGSRMPHTACELDHVVPWTGDEGGGETAAHNLAFQAMADHAHKTAGHHSAAINDQRDITWVTLLGQAATSRPHDYRQYTDPDRRPLDDPGRGFVGLDPDELGLDAAEAALLEQSTMTLSDLLTSLQSPDGLRQWLTLQGDDLETARSEAGQALYALLVHRGPGDLTLDPTDADYPSADPWGWMDVPHRDAALRRHRRRQRDGDRDQPGDRRWQATARTTGPDDDLPPF